MVETQFGHFTLKTEGFFFLSIPSVWSGRTSLFVDNMFRTIKKTASLVYDFDSLKFYSMFCRPSAGIM